MHSGWSHQWCPLHVHGDRHQRSRNRCGVGGIGGGDSRFSPWCADRCSGNCGFARFVDRVVDRIDEHRRKDYHSLHGDVDPRWEDLYIRDDLVLVRRPHQRCRLRVHSDRHECRRYRGGLCSFNDRGSGGARRSGPCRCDRKPQWIFGGFLERTKFQWRAPDHALHRDIESRWPDLHQ